MSVQTGADLPLDVFGGILSEVGNSNMPAGGSPANLNVEFLPGLTRTRGGLQVESNYASIPTAGASQVRYTKSYGQVPEVQTQLALLWNEETGTVNVVNSPTSAIGQAYGYGSTLPWSPFSTNPGWTGPLALSCTQFGREYLAISEGRYGWDIPRQWDGTYYDRVSQIGPGLAPTAADSNATQAIFPSANGLVQYSSNIALIYESNFVVYLQLENETPVLEGAIQVGDSIVIAGVSPSNYNGTWVLSGVDPVSGLLSFPSPDSLSPGTGGTASFGLTLLTTDVPFAYPPQMGDMLTVAGAGVSGYNGTWPVRSFGAMALAGSNQAYIEVATVSLAASGGGTIIAPGSVVAGLHQVSVAFITRQGYITRPAPPSSFTAGGSKQVSVTNIPTGPSNVIARLLIFTPYLTPPAVTGTFYSIRQTNSTTSSVMQINDNTTTSATVNFTDSDLLSGFNAQYLFGLIELGECAGSFPYAGRMFWWGELNSLQDFYGMEFNGGWSLGTGTGGSDVPLGWTNDTSSGAGGSRLANGGVWQDAYRVTGTGSSGFIGLIHQTAFQNWLGTVLIAANTLYSARITVRTSGPANILLQIFNSGLGSLAFINTTVNAPTYQTFILPFSNITPMVIPTVTDLRYSVNDNLGSPVTVDLDRIEIFPTNQPINYTVLRASYASDPESFDGVTGLIQPIYSNGQAVRGVYTLRDSMYICTDRGTFVTKDVPGSEPAFWTVDPVSDTIGCTGPNAVTAGEDWEVKVNRYGLYIYLGREPQKISQEIQDLWNREGSASQINWAYGYKIWATVDLLNKRVYIGAPINGSVECNCIFVMDYNTLDTSEMVAQFPTLRFSAYTGRRVVLEQGRKWTQWQFVQSNGTLLPVPCGTFLEQSDGTAQFVMGGGFDNSVYFIDPTMRGNDNGQPVDSYYTTHFFPTLDEVQTSKPETGPMRDHLHQFSFLRNYIQGFGKCAVWLYENTLSQVSNTNPKLLFNITLQNPAVIDSENTADEAKAERWALKFECNGLDNWFQLERMTRVTEQDPNGMTRGTDMQ